MLRKYVLFLMSRHFAIGTKCKIPAQFGAFWQVLISDCSIDIPKTPGKLLIEGEMSLNEIH